MARDLEIAAILRIAKKKIEKIVEESNSDILLCIKQKLSANISFIPICNLYFTADIFVTDVDNISEFYYSITILLLYIILILYTCFIFSSIILVKKTQLKMFFTIIRLTFLQYTKNRLLSK